MISDNLSTNQICITLDVDWVKDEILEPIIQMIEQAGVKATLFATHQSPLLEELNPQQFELGLHPNFNQVNGDFEKPLRELKTLYPNAKGGRSHSLFVSSHILQLYMKYGLKYESNIFLFNHQNLQPVIRFKDFISIPFYWSDDKYISLGSTFTLNQLHLDALGLKVFNFHPIHIFMNTSSETHYESYRTHYQNPAILRKFINPGEGVGKLFQLLLDYLAGNGDATHTLYEVYENYVNQTNQHE